MAIKDMRLITDDDQVNIRYKYDDTKKEYLVAKVDFERIIKIVRKAHPKRPRYGAWSKYYDRDAG